MEKETKQIKEDDLNKIKELDFKFKKITLDFGKVCFDEQYLKSQLNELNESKEAILLQYKSLQEEEIKLHDLIQATYGYGTLDLETGLLILE